MKEQLLDREDDLGQLSAAFDRVAQGQGSVTLITGEAGIGKTTLLRNFLGNLDPATSVFRGACEDLSIAEPMGPVRDIAIEAGGEFSYDSSSGGALLSVFSDVLSACSRNEHGNVIVIEDFHWADDATADFVRYAARRVGDHPILLIVTSRVERIENRQRLRKAFGDLPVDALLRLELSTLSENAVTELCRNTRLDPAEVYSATGGNAFYVNELIQSTSGALPTSIRDAVMARVDRLTDEGQRALDLVSIFPRQAEVGHVLALGGEGVEEGLECCLDAGLLGSDGDNLFFTHELAREAVRTSLSPLRQRALNRALFDHLNEAGETSLSRLLHHAREAGNSDAVAELAPRAARDAASLGSWPEAATFFDIAIEALGPSADADLLEEAAWASYLSIGLEFAAIYQQRAVDLIDQASDPIRYGTARRKLARFLWFRSDFIGAEANAKIAIDALTDVDGPELALAHSTLAQLYMAAYRFEEVWPHAEKAMEIAEEHERSDILAHALNNYAMSHIFRDREAAKRYMGESLEISLEIGNIDHAGRAMANSMHLEYETCHYREALERARQSAGYSRDHDLDGYYRYALGMQSRAAVRLCQWDEAEDPGTRGFDPDDRIPMSQHANAALGLLSLSVRTGRPLPESAISYLTLFDTDVAEAQRLAPFAEIMAELAWQSGDDLTEAIARLHRAVASSKLPETVGNALIWLKRLGEPVSVAVTTAFPAPFRLELSGDIEGAAKAWAERGAHYDQALVLAFGDATKRSEAEALFKKIGHGPDPARYLAAPKEARRGRPADRGPFGLTKRQIDVLRELDQGKSNARIGESLFISPKTVDHHVSAILAALDVTSRGEAAAKAREYGVI